MPQRSASGAPEPARGYGVLPIATDGGTALVPVPDDEAFWLGLEADMPVALRPAICAPDTLDLVTGLPAAPGLRSEPQNYVVVPPQQWLEGLSLPDRRCARQLVKRSASAHHAVVEELRFEVYLPRVAYRARPQHAAASSIGCEQRGHLPHAVHLDPYGVDYWRLVADVTSRVRIASSDEFTRLTGAPGPEPLDTAKAYRGWRLP